IFFDQVPTSPYLVAPVAVAAGTARRAGLPRVVLNPGQPPDGLYRELGAQVCVFDGPWSRLRTWPGEGAQAGDGYLVHGVPPDERADAEADLAARGAGFALVTDRVPPRPYTAPPSWLDLTSVAG
ncbi:MAG TPA: hypothetical protein VHA75_03355, partial [Rugosimonospora sp.]|nr:hypothetical protein [Rugosimonospora sp.]